VDVPDVPDVPGYARKARGVFEGEQWAESLAEAGISVEEWDDRFRYAVDVNISYQPLQNTTQFLEENHRLLQVSRPNELIGMVYFRIEPDDNNCTLLWIEAKRFTRVG
jgi:hypothetical protein